MCCIYMIKTCVFSAKRILTGNPGSVIYIYIFKYTYIYKYKYIYIYICEFYFTRPPLLDAVLQEHCE